MDVSVRAKERFCKDCNIPIRLFQEPYFTDRLKLFNKFYGTLEKWNIFLEGLQKYHCEQDYFEEYNRVKDAAILSIKESEAYQKFNEEDMNKYRVTYENLPNKDIFKPSNDGKLFISIDMRKANFSSLYHYDNSMFSGAKTWEEFISKFTENKHIINSKYIRQVILGNCNPKRHITYEKYLMNEVLDVLIKEVGYWFDEIVFFSNDEIVIDMDNYADCIRNRNITKSKLEEYFDFPLNVELFYLHKINGTDGYYKEIVKGIKERSFEFKCLDNYMLPFVIRNFLGEEITDSDKVFYHEWLLAKFIEVPKIEVKKDII